MNNNWKTVVRTTLFISSTFSFISPLTNEKFHEISLPKRNFKWNLVVRGTKCHAKFRTFAQNFNDMGTIRAKMKCCLKFAFFKIMHNFSKFCGNSAKFALTAFAQTHEKNLLLSLWQKKVPLYIDSNLYIRKSGYRTYSATSRSRL